LYRPQSGWLAPLEPDLLGEFLVDRAISDDPELVPKVILVSTGAGLHRAITVINRAAARFPASRAALAQVIRENLDKLWEPAIAVGLETGDPVGRLLTAALSRSTDVAMAEKVCGAIPEKTVALREAATVAASRVVKSIVADASTHRPGTVEHLADQMRYASWAALYALRLQQVGKTVDAVTASQAALDTRRALVRSYGGARFEGDLAGSLNNHAVLLAPSDPVAAADYAEEAVRAFEAAPTSGSLAGMRNIATALSTVSTSRRRMGDFAKAIVAADRCVEISRTILNAEPAPAEWSSLASALANQASALVSLARTHEARDAIGEAVGIRRNLAEEKPDAYRPEYARSLAAQAAVLNKLGETELTLAASQKAISIRRELYEYQPGAFRADLAHALNNHVGYLFAAGLHEDARRHSDDAIALYRHLVTLDASRYAADLEQALRNGEHVAGAQPDSHGE
jgi:tetratricopeptide (TPR) repeat protein